MPKEHEGWDASWLYMPGRPDVLVQVIWRKGDIQIIYNAWGEGKAPIKERHYRAGTSGKGLLKGPKGHIRCFKTFEAAEKAFKSA